MNNAHIHTQIAKLMLEFDCETSQERMEALMRDIAELHTKLSQLSVNVTWAVCTRKGTQALEHVKVAHMFLGKMIVANMESMRKNLRLKDDDFYKHIEHALPLDPDAKGLYSCYRTAGVTHEYLNDLFKRA